MRTHLASALLVLAPVALFNTASADDHAPAKRPVDFTAVVAHHNGSTTSLGKTGVVVKIQSAAIAKDGTITVRATIVDADGIPLDRLGVATKGPVSMSFIAAYIPSGQLQAAERERIGEARPHEGQLRQRPLHRGEDRDLPKFRGPVRVHALADRPQGLPAGKLTRQTGRCCPARSGNSLRRPASDASATPRSVMRPVTSRAGVTSKAGLAAALPSGVSATVATPPSGSLPAMWVTSRAGRFSIGISRTPSRTRQSIDGDGTAA